MAIHDDGDGIEFVIYDRNADDLDRVLLEKHKIHSWDSDAYVFILGTFLRAVLRNGQDQ